MISRIVFAREGRLIGLPSLGLTAWSSLRRALSSRPPSASAGTERSTILNGNSGSAPQAPPTNSESGDIDKEDLYGFYRSEYRKDRALARSMAAQGADVPLDEMDVHTSKIEHHYHKSGIGSWVTAALLGAGVAGLVSPDLR